MKQMTGGNRTNVKMNNKRIIHFNINNQINNQVRISEVYQKMIMMCNERKYDKINSTAILNIWRYNEMIINPIIVQSCDKLREKYNEIESEVE